MAVADFALLYDLVNNPVDPPLLPEAISAEHHNPYLINYKNEPIPLRIATKDANGQTVLKTGPAGDMAHVFDSKVHGDPFTEIFHAFESDRVRIKLIQGAQEVQHEFAVQGARWRRNIWDPNSPLVGVQELGISEHFEIELPRMANRIETVNGVKVDPEMDHLYHFGSSDDMWNGAWGVIRYADPQEERSKKDDDKKKLVELKEHSAFDSQDRLIEPEFKSVCPPDPNGQITREFNVQAWAAADLVPGGSVVYNEREGIADPSGLLFIEVADHALTRDDIIASFADKPVEPLVLRANAGECILVHLKNMLPVNVPDHLGDAGLPRITELSADDFRPSNQVSLMPQLVEHDSFRQGGANIGINPDQTVGPGEIADYMWYAGRLDFEPHPTKSDKLITRFLPEEYGAINLNSYGDIIKQGAQGLVGALIIEPEKATVTEDPTTKTMATVCYPVDVNDPQSPTNCFREFVLVYQDGLNLLHLSNDIPDCPICGDSYDLGEKAVNYRTEPFWARLGLLPTNTDTNASLYPPDFFLNTFKTIETPVFDAKPTDKVRFRVLQPHGRARQRTFLVYGHDYNDLGIPDFGTPHASLITIGKGLTAKLTATHEGTWLYRDGPSLFFSGGVWGQFVVKPGTP
ncbi:MAG: hypothetical protein ACE5G9_05405 [Nitrospinales bacterium]